MFTIPPRIVKIAGQISHSLRRNPRITQTSILPVIRSIRGDNSLKFRGDKPETTPHPAMSGTRPPNCTARRSPAALAR